MPDEKTLKRAAAVLVIVTGAVLFRVYGQYFTLSYLNASQAKFAALYAEHPAGVIAAYMAIYILVTSVSLPGAAVMTLAGGALFGLWKGTVIVSFASSIGATIACSVSRFVLRDWVQKKLGDKLSTIREGIHLEGAFYLFTLRLVPLFPFWLINLVMGLTTMRLRTFYWVSQAGMLPATVVYVNAGTELAKLESVKGILSPHLLGSFALLGLFPIAAKKLVEFFRKRNRAGGRPRKHGSV